MLEYLMLLLSRADAYDWPQHWYRRLGFEPIGHYVKLIGPGV